MFFAAVCMLIFSGTAEATVCNSDQECRFDLCTSNAVCNRTASQVATGQPGTCDFSKNSGMPCGVNSTCKTSLCSSAGDCVVTNMPSTTSCNDSNVCTTGDHCSSGVCIGGTSISGCCTSDSQCSIGQKCQNNKCVTVDLCVGVSIDDANACTADSCDPATGLVTHTAIAGCCRNDSECSASSDCYVAKCTLGRSGAGTCSESLKPIGANCDSGMLGVCARGQTACTARGGYICDPLKDPSTDVCDGLDNDCDGEVDEGFNVGSVCSNGNPCKTGVIQCLPKTGTAACVETNLPDGTSCSDSNACTGGDKCLGGACVAGAPLNCDDGNVCTSDICDPSIGCDNKCLGKGTVVTVDGSTMLCQEDCGSAPLECLSDTDCESKNDDDQCNGKLRCNSKGKCELDPATIIPVPASTDPCKVNACEPSTGNIIAKPANEGLECDDGKLLTINDKCLEGTCTGTTVECLTSADCSGDACSTRSCVANKCVATAVSCDDGNICTTDSCDPVLGCKHSAILSGQVNVCGGCADLAGSSLGAACGICSDGLLECDGANATKCVGASTLDTDKDGRPDVCDAPECGNGVVEDGESCDAGALNSDTASNACRTDCQWHRCGDGVWDTSSEQCDDGNLVDDDLCSNSCAQRTCGDGVINTGEVCDAGEMNGLPAFCNSTCSGMTKYCGDGIVDADMGESCDTLNVGDEIFGDTNFEGKSCESLGHKGGGTLLCNTCSIDDSTCSDSLCGDGVKDEGEACDGLAGIDDPIHQKCDELTCQIVDIPPACGNSVVDGSEECDPSVSGGDPLCRENCTRMVCGDGVVDASTGEECDAGLANDDAGACTSSCKSAFCGDGLLMRGSEECDSGLLNGNEPDSCRQDCTLPRCGDDIVDVASGEVCDQGVDNGRAQGVPPYCNADCSAAFKWCGNGVVDSPNDQGVFEECDGFDGVSAAAHEACNESCMKVVMSFCGDGIVQRVNSDGQPEACDDGNNDAFDGCSPECQKEICTENNVSACDDGRACTRDFCDLTGSSPMCAVEDIADCCETDADCVSAAGCMIASCVNNSCVQTQDPTCCLADSGAIVPSGMVLSCNNGACVGTMACSSGAWSQCSAKTASGETCNGVDDDCNGLIDDGVVRECSSICGSGIEICSNGSFGTCNAPQPSVEICDNVDNDCDGMVDEDLGIIECPSGAIAACVGGAIPECPPQISNECDDGNPCTTGDTRDASGNCVGQPKVCVDSDTCTTDSCDMATGECKFAAIEGCGGDVGKKLDTEDASRIFDLEQTRAVALPFSEIRHVEIIGKNEMQVYYLFGCNSSGCGAAFMPMSALRGQAKPVFKLEAALADKEFVAVAKLSGKESYDILMRDQECLYVVPKVDVQLASPAQAELNVQAACLSAANACDEYTITDVQINDPAADGIDDILVKLNCIYPEADTDQPIVEDSSIKFVQLNNSVEKPGAFTAQIVQGQWKDASAELFKFGAGDLSVSMGADAVSTAVEKVFGVNYGSDVGEHFADDKFATGEENVAVSTDTGIRLAKVKTSAASKDGRSGNSVSFEPYPEAVEHYICRSPKDGMLPEKYSEPMVIRSVEMKTFGGPDLSAICSSGNERAAFFYPNINEAPSVRLIDEKGEEIPATGNIIGEEDQFVIAKGIDPTNDRLTYKWECKDSKGADCSAVFTSIKPEEMSILASNSKALIESGAPDMSINASEDVNPTVTKGLPIQGYSCPLTLKVTATDDGGMSSQASASFGCVIDGKYVDIKSTTKGTEGDVTGVGVTGGGLGWAAISGGGCSLVIRR